MLPFSTKQIKTSVNKIKYNENEKRIDENKIKTFPFLFELYSFHYMQSTQGGKCTDLT